MFILVKFIISFNQLSGCSADEFEKIDFFPCTYTLLKLVSLERAFQADHNDLYCFRNNRQKVVLSVIKDFSKFLKKLFLLSFFSYNALFKNFKKLT